MTRPLTRREFVAGAAIIGAGLAVTGAAGCSRAATTVEVAAPSSYYGRGNAMGDRILVGYATSAGSTVGVAQAIGEVLGARGAVVDVRPVNEVGSLEGYRAAVVGSAVHGGQWLPEAVAFLEYNREALGGIGVSLFCVHAMNCGNDATDTKRRLAYLDKERALVKPVAEGFFAGMGPTQADSNWVTRWMYTAFGGDVEGDGRDWAAIRAWARKVPI